MSSSDELPTCLDHVELGEQTIAKATEVYALARRHALLAVTTGTQHDAKHSEVLMAEAGVLAQLATAHFAAAQALTIEVRLSHDDTQPIGLVPVGDPADLRLVDFGPHPYGLGTIESSTQVDVTPTYMGVPDEQEGDDRG